MQLLAVLLSTVLSIQVTANNVLREASSFSEYSSTAYEMPWESRKAALNSQKPQGALRKTVVSKTRNVGRAVNSASSESVPSIDIVQETSAQDNHAESYEYSSKLYDLPWMTKSTSREVLKQAQGSSTGAATGKASVTSTSKEIQKPYDEPAGSVGYESKPHDLPWMSALTKQETSSDTHKMLTTSWIEEVGPLVPWGRQVQGSSKEATTAEASLTWSSEELHKPRDEQLGSYGYESKAYELPWMNTLTKQNSFEDTNKTISTSLIREISHLVPWGKQVQGSSGGSVSGDASLALTTETVHKPRAEHVGSYGYESKAYDLPWMSALTKQKAYEDSNKMPTTSWVQEVSSIVPFGKQVHGSTEGAASGDKAWLQNLGRIVPWGQQSDVDAPLLASESQNAEPLGSLKLRGDGFSLPWETSNLV